ncbi:hypothetical protein KJ068_13140 [bacterium]|nr:hypothetical protein [bacterium]
MSFKSHSALLPNCQNYLPMTKLRTFVVVLAIILKSTVVCSQEASPRYALAGFVGWYMPSLAKANAALEYSRQKFSGIGDDEFGGHIAIGGFFERSLSHHWLIRSEIFYWWKDAQQLVSSVDDAEMQGAGEGHANIRLIPITINTVYRFSNLPNVCLVYCGMGAGIVLSKLRVNAHVQQNDSLIQGGSLGAKREVFFAEDANWGILLQILAGARFRCTSSISIFIETRLVSGQFRVEEPRYKVDEQVFLSGFSFFVGMTLGWGR